MIVWSVAVWLGCSVALDAGYECDANNGHHDSDPRFLQLLEEQRHQSLGPRSTVKDEPLSRLAHVPGQLKLNVVGGFSLVTIETIADKRIWRAMASVR